jgi:hypothetical protein
MPTIRDLLYLSGDLFLPKHLRAFLERYWIGNTTSLFYVTNWSILHALTGILIGYILKTYYPDTSYYTTGLYIHTVWEVWQLAVRNTPGTFRGIIDVFTDTAFFMAGMMIMKPEPTSPDENE